MKSLSVLIDATRLGPNLSRIIEGSRSRIPNRIAVPRAEEVDAVLPRDDWAFWQSEPDNTPSADELLTRMRQQKLSYRKAAAATGYPHSYIYEVLHGKRLNPGYRVRHRIAALLDSMESGESDSTTTTKTKKATAAKCDDL